MNATERPRTPWAVHCPKHGQVFLTQSEYEAQLDIRDHGWICPVPVNGEPCGELSAWDDENYEVATPAVETAPAVPLACPNCEVPHVDEGAWAVRPHRRHLCANCGYIWRIDPPVFGAPRAQATEEPPGWELLDVARKASFWDRLVTAVESDNADPPPAVPLIEKVVALVQEFQTPGLAPAVRPSPGSRTSLCAECGLVPRRRFDVEGAWKRWGAGHRTDLCQECYDKLAAAAGLKTGVRDEESPP